MSKFREKAQGRTKQIVGQMLDDNQLVEEGKEQEQHAEQEEQGAESGGGRPDRTPQQPPE